MGDIMSKEILKWICKLMQQYFYVCIKFDKVLDICKIEYYFLKFLLRGVKMSWWLEINKGYYILYVWQVCLEY